MNALHESNRLATTGKLKLMQGTIKCRNVNKVKVLTKFI